MDLGTEVREGGGDSFVEVGGGRGGNEVEASIFRAGGVLEDGKNSGHGAAEVREVQSHSHVHCLLRAHVFGGD